jgi:hypothetical protein
MALAKNKTIKTEVSANGFLDTIADEKKRKDAYALLDLMTKVSKEQPKMWGTAIIGFGDSHFVSPSGREGTWFLIGFSPRKANFALYCLGPKWDTFDSFKDLGKFKMGGGCLYINKLEDVNAPALKKLLSDALKSAKATNKEMATQRKH